MIARRAALALPASGLPALLDRHARFAPRPCIAASARKYRFGFETPRS